MSALVEKLNLTIDGYWPLWRALRISAGSYILTPNRPRATGPPRTEEFRRNPTPARARGVDWTFGSHT
ncbi:MAG: hypothetical protein JWO04_752 [Gammaproteobacteria bacterium]|nr:hypothetical protein [Gammaproteobacteria bacterium]